MSFFYACLFFFAGLQTGTATISSTISPDPSQKINVIIEAAVQTIKIGDTVRFTCVGRSEDDNGEKIGGEWQRKNGPLPPDRSYTDASGILIISDVKVSDSGTYVCQVSDEINTTTRDLNLTVEAICSPPPAPIVAPVDWLGGNGDNVRLECVAPYGVGVTWSRSDNTSLPANAFQVDGVLKVLNASPSDSGFYVCTATTFQGLKRSTVARVSIRSDQDTDECRFINNKSSLVNQSGSEVEEKYGRLNLTTYPTDQVIRESRTVAIRCGDEGSIRTRVHWVREDGAPLPPGSTDRNGTLEMPNIQVIHSGIYVCEALGFPENTPGRRVISHLTVERAPRPCQYNEATCPNGECIPKSNVCDGISDCTDGSDELRCGLPCNYYNEFECASGFKCIHKTFHCDRANDCADGSDEVGCTMTKILRPPPRMVDLEVGELFKITCTAIGIPIPEISWRLNLGQIPDKCTTTSINGTGVLTCPSIAIEDQGAYSCEGINNLGWDVTKSDTMLRVQKPEGTVCPRGTFNSKAVKPDDCISCFCSGVTAQCTSADLFTYQFLAPFDQYNFVNVQIDPHFEIRADPVDNAPNVRVIGKNGVHFIDRYFNSWKPDGILYFALPEGYRGNQLKSYGGYLNYTVRYGGLGIPNTAPSVILTGNKYILVHNGRDTPPNFETEKTVRFFFGDWLKKEGQNEIPASREDIMATLANVEKILIKIKFNDKPIKTTITNVLMDTADVRNTNQGANSFVEECCCPVGYTGLSCEDCDSGYQRHESGPSRGQCFKDLA